MGKRYLLGMWTTAGRCSWAVAARFGYPQAHGTRACGEAGPREGRCRETVLPAKGRACRRAGERFLSSKQKERNEKVMAEDGLWLS